MMAYKSLPPMARLIRDRVTPAFLNAYRILSLSPFQNKRDFFSDPQQNSLEDTSWITLAYTVMKLKLSSTSVASSHRAFIATQTATHGHLGTFFGHQIFPYSHFSRPYLHAFQARGRERVRGGIEGRYTHTWGAMMGGGGGMMGICGEHDEG